MAALAFVSITALGKLTTVWIRFVAIGTSVVCYRSFEISAGMALDAANGRVFAFEREVRPRVIERRRENRLLPSKRRVTRVASLLECALVRIHAVAVRAVRKRESRVTRLSILIWCMTAFAKHIAMFSRQWKPCLRVIESFLADICRLPIRCRVAPRTIGSEPSLVLVFMARPTTRR